MTIRNELLSTLETYRKTWCVNSSCYPGRIEAEESPVTDHFLSFVSATPQCFERKSHTGHLTGSALVVNKDLTKVLLTHHKKLNMWLQLGGHADGHYLLHEVAMTEASEESGLTNLSHLHYASDIFGASVLGLLPFDLDCHLIPANTKDPEHRHYDVRYLIIAALEELPVVSHESHDVRWFELQDARLVTTERSMHRQFDKLEWLKNKLSL